MQQRKHEQCRFSILMKEMQSSNEDYLASILAFINCVLKGANDLKKRIRLRNEFLGKIFRYRYIIKHSNGGFYDCVNNLHNHKNHH